MRLSNPFNSFQEEFQAIFIHIPKTAGSSVCKTMIGRDVGHLPIAVYECFSSEKTSDYFKFTFVRHPVDRFISAFYYLKGGGGNDLDQSWAVKHLSSYATVEEFVTALRASNSLRSTVLSWIHFIPQYRFLINREKKIDIDFIGKFETIDKDFHSLTEQLKVDRRLIKSNSSKKAQRSSLTSESERFLKNLYFEDIRFFGYE